MKMLWVYDMKDGRRFICIAGSDTQADMMIQETYFPEDEDHNWTRDIVIMDNHPVTENLIL